MKLKGYLIKGGRTLRGEVSASGAKNAALPIMAACLLTEEPLILKNVPVLRDVDTFVTLLGGLGVEVKRSGAHIRLQAHALAGHEAPYELVKQMRASIVVLGPLVARMGRARVSLPGGCAIGERPIDQHLKGLQAMGADIDIHHGYIEARARRLKGARIPLDMPSVTGTENLMMAAVLADGVTVIDNAAREPEVADLAKALVAMGADIEGAGEASVTIKGTRTLAGTEHTVMPDRIETATYLAAGLITGGRVSVNSCRPEHLEAVVAKLTEAGGAFEVGDGRIAVTGPDRPRTVDIRTMPYPGFPTDMQAQMMAVLALAEGHSVISETIFENRFRHAAELNRMGADITIQGHSALIRGVRSLSGAPVMATDLRAAAGLVLAGLAAEGETTVSRVYHLERGYETMVAKMNSLGADIQEVQVA